MENILIAFQILTTVAVIFGIYKNKTDVNEKKLEEFKDISERLARLEEKVNFLIQTTKKTI